jgi:hypothetical protein
MQYVLLIYQGSGWDRVGSLSDEEKEEIGAQYAAVLAVPGVTPGPPLGLPQDATTVRVDNGTRSVTDGPYVDAAGAIGGSLLLEADNLEDVMELAARVPAARLGGGVEIRPVGTYW